MALRPRRKWTDEVLAVHRRADRLPAPSSQEWHVTAEFAGTSASAKPRSTSGSSSTRTLGVSELRRVRSIEEENARLKRLGGRAILRPSTC